MRFGSQYDTARTTIAAARIQIRREDNPQRETRRQQELHRMANREIANIPFYREIRDGYEYLGHYSLRRFGKEQPS